MCSSFKILCSCGSFNFFLWSAPVCNLKSKNTSSLQVSQTTTQHSYCMTGKRKKCHSRAKFHAESDRSIQHHDEVSGSARLGPLTFSSHRVVIIKKTNSKFSCDIYPPPLPLSRTDRQTGQRVPLCYFLAIVVH